MTERINALLVTSDETLRDELATSAAESLDLRIAGGCSEARSALASGAPVDVVAADLTMDDGNWWCIYQDLAKRDLGAELIVVMPPQGSTSPKFWLMASMPCLPGPSRAPRSYVRSKTPPHTR